jgi:general secretion pathway protein J
MMLMPVNKQGGFTLLEMLVATTMLGMLLAMLYSGLRLGINSAAAAEERIQQVSRIRVTQEFLRSQFSRIQPVTWKYDGNVGVVFEGESDRIQFVAPMPGYVGEGGPHLQLIELVSGKDGMELIFDHRVAHPEFDGDVEPDMDREPILLLDGIEDAHFSYLSLDDDNEAGDWTESWDAPGHYPILVRLEIELPEAAGVTWPVLTVAPLIDPRALNTARQSRLTFGPRPND